MVPSKPVLLEHALLDTKREFEHGTVYKDLKGISCKDQDGFQAEVCEEGSEHGRARRPAMEGLKGVQFTQRGAGMCSGSEAGSYLRLIDFVYHSTLGLRVIQKKKVGEEHNLCAPR